MALEASPETCPHDISGASSEAGLRQLRIGDTITHVSQCVRCETKVYVVLDRREA
jgi:hypothetical protein